MFCWEEGHCSGGELKLWPAAGRKEELRGKGDGNLSVWLLGCFVAETFWWEEGHCSGEGQRLWPPTQQQARKSRTPPTEVSRAQSRGCVVGGGCVVVVSCVDTFCFICVSLMVGGFLYFAVVCVLWLVEKRIFVW